MKITVLGSGTSGGVPMIGCSCAACISNNPRDQRLRASIWVQTPAISIVVDAGPDFRQQMLRAKVGRLDAILLTHAHRDHTAGFDDIRAYNYFQQKPLDVYVSEASEKSLRKEYHYVFEEAWYPGLPQMNLLRLENKPFQLGDLCVEPVEVRHYRMPVFGFRFGSAAYITDANAIEETEKSKLYKLDVLILNALRKDPHLSHFSLSEAIDLAKDLKPRKTYFTHISHQMGCFDDVNSQLPDGMELAWDGLELVL